MQVLTTEAPELSSASPSPSCPARTEVDLAGDQWFVLMEPSRVENQLLLPKRSKRTNGSRLSGRSDVLLRSFRMSAGVHRPSALFTCLRFGRTIWCWEMGKGVESEESGWTQSS